MDKSEKFNLFDMLPYQELSHRWKEEEQITTRHPNKKDDEDLLHIIDVMDSCTSIDQLILTRDWGKRVLNETPTLSSIIEVKFDSSIDKLQTSSYRNLKVGKL